MLTKRSRIKFETSEVNRDLAEQMGDSDLTTQIKKDTKDVLDKVFPEKKELKQETVAGQELTCVATDR